MGEALLRGLHDRVRRVDLKVCRRMDRRVVISSGCGFNVTVSELDWTKGVV